MVLVRHGQTTMTVSRGYSGSGEPGPPLDETGAAGARRRRPGRPRRTGPGPTSRSRARSSPRPWSARSRPARSSPSSSGCPTGRMPRSRRRTSGSGKGSPPSRSRSDGPVSSSRGTPRPTCGRRAESRSRTSAAGCSGASRVGGPGRRPDGRRRGPRRLDPRRARSHHGRAAVVLEPAACRARLGEHRAPLRGPSRRDRRGRCAERGLVGLSPQATDELRASARRASSAELDVEQRGADELRGVAGQSTRRRGARPRRSRGR